MRDFKTLYAAMLRRDPTLDGVIFVAVKTTGVYCRPVCRARIPLAKNIRFCPCAAAAESSGYRPSLRCRPETAPFCPAWKGTKTTVERAPSMIEAGALDSNTADALALRLGIGARHLSRVFAEHLSASPLQVAQTLRVQRARRLLDTTTFAVATIAARASFPSARRMNAAIRQLYGRSPSELAQTPIISSRG
jgi:AraC family transcriptional regulator, regulatory protein of adaptative response / methylated-DNA-[protein]-cysteine methyltransferase